MRAVTILMALLTGGCAPQPPLMPVASVEQLMEGTVHPAAEVLFKSVGTIISEKGVEEIAPRNDEEWANVRNNAVTLAESGNLLMIGKRAKDQGDWMKMAQGLIEAGVAATKATEAKDVQALFDAGGKVYEACERCHGRYRKK